MLEEAESNIIPVFSSNKTDYYLTKKKQQQPNYNESPRMVQMMNSTTRC